MTYSTNWSSLHAGSNLTSHGTEIRLGFAVARPLATLWATRKGMTFASQFGNIRTTHTHPTFRKIRIRIIQKDSAFRDITRNKQRFHTSSKSSLLGRHAQQVVFLKRCPWQKSYDHPANHARNQISLNLSVDFLFSWSFGYLSLPFQLPIWIYMIGNYPYLEFPGYSIQPRGHWLRVGFGPPGSRFEQSGVVLRCSAELLPGPYQPRDHFASFTDSVRAKHLVGERPAVCHGGRRCSAHQCQPVEGWACDP